MQQGTVLEADEAMPSILSSLKAVRPHTTFNFEGFLLHLGDFQVCGVVLRSLMPAILYLP